MGGGRREGGEEGGGGGGEGGKEEEEEEEKDPNQLDLDLTLLVEALQKFHKDREDLAVQKGLNNMGSKKKKEKFARKKSKVKRDASTMRHQGLESSGPGMQPASAGPSRVSPPAS